MKKCEICNKRKKVIDRLNKLNEFEREAKRTNKIKGFFDKCKNPLEVTEKGLTETTYEKEKCPKCKSSLMDAGVEFDWKNNRWKSHKHICSERYRCGWESDEFEGGFIEIL